MEAEQQGAGRLAIPEAGLREYWYPAARAKDVPRARPLEVRLLGEDLVLFRAPGGSVGAIDAVCPHRGGRIADGRCHKVGTVTCPYHGWTFDGSGECLAVLGEGPDSRIPGRPGSRAGGRPVRVLKGVAFVWMGEGEPVPVEQDVPPEFFDERARVFTELRVWDCNWRPTVENYSDAHVFYVHRRSMLVLSMPWSRLGSIVPGSAVWPRPKALPSGALTVGGPAAAPKPTGARVKRQYPKLGLTWPASDARYRLARLLDAIHWRRPGSTADFGGEGWSFMRLPGILRAPFRHYVYTRTVVPIDGSSTRIVYCHTRYPTWKGQDLRVWIQYHLFYRWYSNRNFSGQDARVLKAQDYGAREHLSASDSVTVAWRNLVLRQARRAPGVEPESTAELPAPRTLRDKRSF